jgi:uncharacterized Zn finger protein
MDIYRNLGETSIFLDLRKKDLHYGSDYYELVLFYEEQGDVEQALSYAHKGLKKGDGRVDHLIQYLFDHYEKKEDTGALEDIMRISEQIKKECALVSNRLFNYYSNRGDYENAKKYVLKEFEYFGNSNLDKQYNRIKEYMNESDWQTVRDTLFGELEKRDLTGYLNICLDEGLKQEVYDIIFEKKRASNNFSLLWGIDRDYFADKLKRDFPEEIGEYFAQLALRHVEGGAGPNRKGYIQAVSYYRKVKEIYAQILKDKHRWERLLTDMKERYQRRKAFIEEMRVLE